MVQGAIVVVGHGVVVGGSVVVEHGVVVEGSVHSATIVDLFIVPTHGSP